MVDHNRNFKVKDELTFPFVTTLLYIVTLNYLQLEISIFYGLFFLPQSVNMYLMYY